MIGIAQSYVFVTKLAKSFGTRVEPLSSTVQHTVPSPPQPKNTCTDLFRLECFLANSRNAVQKPLRQRFYSLIFTYVSGCNFAAVAMLVLICSCPVIGEEIVIDLKKGLTDPLIDYVPPPPGSPDRVQFTSEGMRILQFGDVAGRPTGLTGFKSTVAASGDFTVTLEAKIRKLTGPSQGWGHGLIFAVFLDDEAQTTLKLNQIAYPGSSHHTTVEISGRNVSQPFYARGDQPLTDGKLIISRRSREVVFSIEPTPGAKRIEVARHECPTNDVRNVEVWSTRVEKGNAPSDIIIKKLTLESDAFYSFKRPVLGWITWWQGLIAAHFVVIAMALAFRAWQSRSHLPGAT